MGLFILVKRKKKLLGVIPAKRGASLSELKKLIRTQLSKGFSARVINEATLKRILKRMLPAKAKRLLRKSKIISRKRKTHKKKSHRRKSKKLGKR